MWLRLLFVVLQFFTVVIQLIMKLYKKPKEKITNLKERIKKG